MAQHDYIISNQTFPNTRADLNNVLQAIATCNKGSSAPTTQYAGQMWIDDSAGTTWTLYLYDGSDNIQVATIDTTANTINFIDSVVTGFDIVTDTTPQLGGNLDLNSNNITGTGNINITGTLTATGNLTSLGIDDNATSTAVTVDSSGNVGIGATTIPEVLTANKSSNGAITGLSINNDYPTDSTASAGTGSGIRFGVNDATFSSAFGDARGSEILSVTQQSNGRSRDIVFKTDNAGSFGEVMRIDSSGNVGIGTTNTSAGKLNIQPNSSYLRVKEGRVDATNNVRLEAGGTVNTYLEYRGYLGHIWDVDSTEVMRLDSSGNAIFKYGALLEEGTLTDGATIAWDVNASPVAKVTLGGNRTISAPSNAVGSGQFISLLVIQDGTGSRTLTWNAVYEFASDTAPTLTTTGGKGDLFVFRYNGTKWLEVGRNLNLTLS
jgi:hypothetical protein